MKDATITTVRAGKGFAIANDTELGVKLRILLSGKLAVKCDEIFLHFVMPLEFVDSIEWRARDQENPSKFFQVIKSFSFNTFFNLNIDLLNRLILMPFMIAKYYASLDLI